METTKKSWSRELTFVLFMWLGYLSWAGGKEEVLEILVWPIFTFGMFSFGFVSSTSQLQWPIKTANGGRT